MTDVGNEAASRVPLQQTNVILRLDSVGAEESHISGIVRPGVYEYVQAYPLAAVHYRVTAGQAVIGLVDAAAGRVNVSTMQMDDTIAHSPGQRHVLMNPNPVAWEFTASFTPAWHADTSFYEFAGRRVQGRDVWFEIKVSPDDTERRPRLLVYPVGSAGAAAATAILEPGVRGFTEYNTRYPRLFTVRSGAGTLVVDGTEHDLSVGDTVQVSPNQRSRLINTGREQLAVQMEPGEESNWRPEDNFFEVAPGTFARGSDVWFEVILPMQNFMPVLTPLGRG